MENTKWSNPSPAGLVALAIACYCFFAILGGHVDHSAMPLIGCWLIGGFIVQFAVAIIDLRTGNTTGGNTFLFFSAFFMLVGGIEMIMKYNFMINEIPFDGRVDGFAWIVLTVSLILWTPAFFKTALVPLVLVLDMALPFITLMDLGILDKAYSNIPAVLLLIAGSYAIYLAASIIVNSAYGRVIYPTIRLKFIENLPMVKEKAL